MAVAAVADAVLSEAVCRLRAVLDDIEVATLITYEKMVFGAAVGVNHRALSVLVNERMTGTAAEAVVLRKAVRGWRALESRLPDAIVDTMLESVVVAAVQADLARVLVGNRVDLSQSEWDRCYE